MKDATGQKYKLVIHISNGKAPGFLPEAREALTVVTLFAF